jgi:hypothetical protein
MRDTQGERGREEIERKREYQNPMAKRDERKTKRRTRRRGTRSEEGNEESGRRERREREARREGGGKRTWNEVRRGEESGPFDGAFVGSRGALRFATKIVALPARARRSAPRRVICCEFINATIVRRSNGASPSVVSRRVWAAPDLAHVRIQSSF